MLFVGEYSLEVEDEKYQQDWNPFRTVMDVYQWLARFLPPVGTVLSNNTVLAAVVVTLVTTVSVRWLQVLHRGKTSPPSLWDPVPCVYNTAQFVFNNTRFTVRVR